MRRMLVPCAVFAIALTAFARSASAQNPFLIDGVVTDASNSKATGAAARAQDAHLNSKELAPIQGSSTKFPVIDTAAVTMLDATAPSANQAVDLFLIYTQTEKDAAGNTWFYFGWTKDSSTGSGFVSFEAHQTGNSCVSYSTADLLNCNPWSPRTDGDFAIFWDQSGGSKDVYLRVWDGNQHKFVPDQPGVKLDPAIAVARYGGTIATPDTSVGELAFNLTGAGLVQAGSCKSFANVIPLTITGNSQGDQADVKDAVFAPISINTCGGITVTKVTLGPDGNNKVDTTSAFPYKLERVTPSAAVIADTTITGCTSATTCTGEVDTYSDLPSGTFKLTENTASLPGKYVFKSLVCGGNTIANGATFTLAESTTVACVITNNIPKGNPTLQTTPTVKALLYDSLTVTLENDLPANTVVSNVTIELFKGSSNCTAGKVGERTGLSITFTNGHSGSVSTLDGTNNAPPAFLIISVTPGGDTYYWKVTYPGDSLNNGANSCGEATFVNWTLPGS